MAIYFDHQIENIITNAGFPTRAVMEGISPRHREYLTVGFDTDTNFVTITDNNSGKKQQGKPASMLRRLLYPMVAEVVPDTVFETIANKLKAYGDLSRGTIEIWDADRIAEAYLEENYAPAHEVNVGTLYSCMRYDWAQKFMSWYKSIGSGLVQIAVLIRNSDQKILGRALVWNLPDGRTFMDRVYGSDSTRELFKNYAQEQGWWKRYYDSYDYKQQWINPETREYEQVNMEIEVPRKKRILRNVPYIDTFSYVDLTKGTIHNNSHHFTTDVYLEVTRGRVEHNFDRMVNDFGFYEDEIKEQAEEYFVNEDVRAEVEARTFNDSSPRYIETLAESVQTELVNFLSRSYSGLFEQGYNFSDQDLRQVHRELTRSQSSWIVPATHRQDPLQPEQVRSFVAMHSGA